MYYEWHSPVAGHSSSRLSWGVSPVGSQAQQRPRLRCCHVSHAHVRGESELQISNDCTRRVIQLDCTFVFNCSWICAFDSAGLLLLCFHRHNAKCDGIIITEPLSLNIHSCEKACMQSISKFATSTLELLPGHLVVESRTTRLAMQRQFGKPTSDHHINLGIYPDREAYVCVTLCDRKNQQL